MITWRLACRQVSYEDGGPFFSGGPDGAFTPLERIHSAAKPGREGLGGRLAAKLAVAEVLGRSGADAALLRQIGILPQPRIPCSDPLLCQRGHPPGVALADDLRGPSRGEGGSLIGLDVSISHESGVAFAAALAVIDDGR
jgi:phosphopantetheinyl transferase (holo-ACP synthase)